MIRLLTLLLLPWPALAFTNLYTGLALTNRAALVAPVASGNDYDVLAASTSFADVGTAYSNATAGQIIQIPAGTSTWTSVLTIAKPVTIQGMGTNSTRIKNNRSISFNYDTGSMHIDLESGDVDELVAIKKIAFEAVTAPSGSGGLVGISSSYADTWPLMVRISECLFTNFQFAIVPQWFGVCDHSTFQGNKASLRWPCLDNTPALPGSPPYAMGSSNWFFVEDSVISMDDNSAYWYIDSDSEGPSLQAIRYSTFNFIPGETYHQMFDMHGSGCSGSISSVGALLYRNTINAAGVDVQICDIRGGNGSLIYSNSVVGSGATAYATVRNDPAGSTVPTNTYCWGNTDPAGAVDMDTGSSLGTPEPVENTHFFNTAPAGFAEYTYPHPLTQ